MRVHRTDPTRAPLKVTVPQIDLVSILVLFFCNSAEQDAFYRKNCWWKTYLKLNFTYKTTSVQRTNALTIEHFNIIIIHHMDYTPLLEPFIILVIWSIIAQLINFSEFPPLFLQKSTASALFAKNRNSSPPHQLKSFSFYRWK